MWNLSLALLRIDSGNGNRFCAFRARFQLGGPLQEMVERNIVGAVQMQRRNGSRAIEDRRVIAFRIDTIDVLLFVEPVETAPARVGAFLQHVARHFLGLPRAAYAAIPD